MNIIIAILLIIFAGIINGSFALPTKYVPKWRLENIWLNYSVWGTLILPWFVMFYLAPQIIYIYAKAPANLLLAIMIGGCTFGIGQVCFALALDIIGFGLGFIINLGIGIGLGFALPLVIQHPQKIFTAFGLVTIIGVLVAIVGLIISNHAGVLRNRNRIKISQAVTKNYFFGIGLAVIAGLSSAGQNFTFSYTQGMQSLAINMGVGNFAAANIIWPGYLLCSFIPYGSHMLYLHYKNHSFNAYLQKGISMYYLFPIIMGIFSYGSILLYSKASQLIGVLGPMIGWPMFMISIVLTSSFWGWQQKEWYNCGKSAENAMKLGLVFLIISVLIFGSSSFL